MKEGKEILNLVEEQTISNPFFKTTFKLLVQCFQIGGWEVLSKSKVWLLDPSDEIKSFLLGVCKVHEITGLLFWLEMLGISTYKCWKKKQDLNIF